MNIRIARAALLATILWVFSHGANMSHTTSALVDSFANGRPDDTYPSDAVPAAAYSSSIWQLLASYHH